MTKPAYRCLYNHELLILSTTQTPYQTYRENITDAQVTGYVRELAGTGVDALMCCPQAWMTPAYYSEIDRKWQDEAPSQVEPLPESDWKYHDKAYYRLRRYMLQKKDPVALSLAAAREIGIAFFLSYRMNEAHYLNYPDCPTHSRFWREHPEFRIRPGGCEPLNYLVPEVHDRYLALLFELIERYDIDGFELDFMRWPRFFPADKIVEGRGVMTGFVRRIRRKLDEVGRSRGKQLLLCVRIPRTLVDGERIGLDPAAWDRERLIDMANLSSFFLNTPEVDIAGMKKLLLGTRIYGELHFVTQPGNTAAGYTNNISRKTNRQTYETTALSFLDRGADGLSFFNFAYTRDHSFAEPRRRDYPGVEPPFDVLKSICDTDYLRLRPKQYVVPPGFGTFPLTLGSPSGPAEITLYVADRFEAGHPFRRAVLRLEADRPCGGYDIAVTLNGSLLQRTAGCGELFPPLSPEGLPGPDRLLFYAVPLTALRHGNNRITVENRLPGEYGRENITFRELELGIYTTQDG